MSESSEESKARHTPGPWGIESIPLRGRDVWITQLVEDRPNRGFVVGEVRITGEYAEEGAANARLIAAAPEMLEAAKAFIRETDDAAISLKAVGAKVCLLNAIAKAEGRDD